MDGQPRIGLKIHRRGRGGMGTAVDADDEGERAAEGRDGFDEVGACRRHHDCAPLEAVSATAVLMRLYVQQRQMFVMASMICASVGCGVCANRAEAAISWPD